MFFRFSYFELSGYNGNNGHVFTKKPELAFRVLTAISGIKFYFFKKFFLGFASGSKNFRVSNYIKDVILFP